MAIEFNCVKMGTKPFGSAIVKGKRKMPKEGEIIQIRRSGEKNLYQNPWIRVEIDEITEHCVFVTKLSQY